MVIILAFFTICFAVLLVSILMGCFEDLVLKNLPASGYDVLGIIVCIILFLFGLFLTIARIVG